MIDPYIPKKFGLDYYEFKGHMQYPIFLSLALGLKPCMDDWVPVKDYERFVQMCKKYEVHVIPDIVFKKHEIKDIVGGKKNITTDFHEGIPFNYNMIGSDMVDKSIREGSVHVVMSKNKKLAENARNYCWYPVVIKDRTINKPFVDHLKYGNYLGYPDCCIDSFRKFNDWSRFSHPHESYKQTKGEESYYTNFLLMDKGISYIHHIPCAYDCQNTIKYAKLVEEKINEVEPGFVEIARKQLRYPAIVFGERNYLIFDGRKDKNIIRYDRFEYISNYARPEDDLRFVEKIEGTEKVELKDNKLIFYSDNNVVYEHFVADSVFMLGWC